MNELQTLESIIKSKPEGATHYAENFRFLVFNSSNKWMRYDPNGLNGFCWFNADKLNLESIKNIRSLADIQKQIDQLKEIKSLRSQLDAWAEKYSALKIESDANKWAHDNMQQKLASIKTICYECDTQVWELSPRSRCLKCEHRRAIFNEKDSD
jgi:hypothetical protein